MPTHAGTAAENALDTEAKKLARREKKRVAMAAKYADPVWREAKKQSVLARWHLLHPSARWGVRGRLPRVTVTEQEISDDAASAASTPRSAIPAAAVILAGSAVGAALAAIL